MSRRRVLLDENVPVQLRLWLPPGIDAVTVGFLGWKGTLNGELVRRAQAAGFAVLITADRRLALTPRSWAPLACVYITPNKFERLKAGAERIADACRAVLPGQVLTVQV